MIRFDFLTLFPEVFPAILQASLLGKAKERGGVDFGVTQIRDFATDKHQTTDEPPYGGGEGMLLKADVLYRAWDQVRSRGPSDRARARTVFLSPQGRPFTQDLARELAKYEQLILVCGHYEGIDERFIEKCVDEEVSLGDYVLTGGELPALVIADVVCRLVPGVIGNNDSVIKDSFENGLLKYPQYTRPREFEGAPVPDVLLSGNHEAIARWRQTQMEERTARKRPDLWARYREVNPEKEKKKRK